MMAQLGLFDGPVARGKTRTSAAAADKTQPKAPSIRERVYEVVCFAGSGGATCEEAAAILDLPTPSVRPRLTDLKDAGLIVDSQRERPNAWGNDEIVWIKRSEA